MNWRLMRIQAAILLLLTAAGCAHAPAAAPTAMPEDGADARPIAGADLPFVEPPVAPMPGEVESRRARKLADQGRLPEALALFERVWSQGNRSPRTAYAAAVAAVNAGRKPQALTWLTRAVELGITDEVELSGDSDLAPLRDEPGFHALLQRIPSLPALFPGSHAELKQLLAADQADRAVPLQSPQQIERLIARDAARRKRVKEMVAERALKTGADYFAAGLVFQHGHTAEDYALARQMGLEAAKAGHPSGLWLAAAAWDRWLMTEDRPQRFGTQYQGTSGLGEAPPQLHLYEMDTTVTDEERARWGFLPLAEIPDTLD